MASRRRVDREGSYGVSRGDASGGSDPRRSGSPLRRRALVGPCIQGNAVATLRGRRNPFEHGLLFVPRLR
jgi:hypothetical protein